MSNRKSLQGRLPHDRLRVERRDALLGQATRSTAIRRRRGSSTTPSSILIGLWALLSAIIAHLSPRRSRRARTIVRPGYTLRSDPRAGEHLRYGQETRNPLKLNWIKVGGLGMILILLIWIGSSLASRSRTYVARSETVVPSLEHPVVAWYAPDQEVFGAIAAHSTYRPVARYGTGWVQLEFTDQGQFWVRAADVPFVVLDGLPDLRPAVIGYSAYTVAPGDSLRQIAILGGSDSTLIGQYNRLRNPPLPGRPLIVPHLRGQRNLLSPTPLIIKEGRTDQPWVALTIDLESGEAPVQRMLDILRERNVQLTIFVLGPWVEQHPELARQIVRDGHELANHSFTHPDFRTLPNEQIGHELAETERVVQEITGATTRPYFRPPYGRYDERVLLQVSAQGYLTIHWSIDSGDATAAEKPPAMILQEVIGSRQPTELHGAIILTHCCLHTGMVDALPMLLDRLNDMGLEVRTVSEVLGA